MPAPPLAPDPLLAAGAPPAEAVPGLPPPVAKALVEIAPLPPPPEEHAAIATYTAVPPTRQMPMSRNFMASTSTHIRCRSPPD